MGVFGNIWLNLEIIWDLCLYWVVYWDNGCFWRGGGVELSEILFILGGLLGLWVFLGGVRGRTSG